MSGEHLARVWRGEPALRRFVVAVLDRRDARGGLPASITHEADAGDLTRLEALLPPRAVSRRGDALRVDLRRLERLLAEDARDHGAAPPVLEHLLDEVSGREPRDVPAERAAWTREAVACLGAAVERGRMKAEGAGAPHDDIAVSARLDAVLAEIRGGRGPWTALARSAGLRTAASQLELLVAGLALARVPRDVPLRLDDLALLATGQSKSLRPGTDAYARLADGLLELDPLLASQVEAELPGSMAVRRRLALEGVGLVVNDTSVDVVVQGDVSVRLGSEVLDDAGKLWRAGLPAKLTLATLRTAAGVHTTASIVTTIENEGPFHSRATAARADELCVFTAGQANWAVVLLLRGLAKNRPDLVFRHAGDLDPAGFAILRSLRRRTGLSIRAFGMSRAVLSRCHDVALGLSPQGERAALAVLEGWPPGDEYEALHSVLAERRWLEQEAAIARLGWDLDAPTHQADGASAPATGR